MFAGYALIFVRLRVMESLLMQDVDWINTTGEHIVAYWAREGEGLRRHAEFSPGQEYRLSPGITRQGPWLRVVAFRQYDPPVSQGQNEMLVWTLSSTDEQRFAERKLFDQTFSWDTLKNTGGRVVIASARGSPWSSGSDSAWRYPMPVGPTGLTVVLVIVMFLFGVGKLPEVGSALGRGIKEFREATREEEPKSEPEG